MTDQDKDTSKGGRPAIILLPVLILAGLLLVPPTRALLRMQTILLFDSTAFAARLRDLGVKTGPMPTVQKWEQSRPAEILAHFPDDYNVQLAGALLAGANTPGGYRSTPQEQSANFQRRFGARLTALSLHFPDRPGPYAHLLRLMTMSTVRQSRSKEEARFQHWMGKAALQDRQIGCAESWAAFDNAAAQGEKLDPDNAYFPLMRAIGLFDAKRDAEGVAAVLRAGQKSRFEDYSLEEPAAASTLYRRTYGVDSALLRESTYAALLLPHFSAIRAVARLSVAKAAEKEQAGRCQEGVALRHAVMQCAVRMREQGGTLSVLVGYGVFSIQMQSPGGAWDHPLPGGATDHEKYTARRKGYHAFLQRLKKTEEGVWVEREDAANQEARDLIQGSSKDRTLEAHVQSLPGFWMTDLLLLANTLALFGMCTLAILMGMPKMRSGEKILPWAALAVLVCCTLAAFQMQWAEALTQMRMVLDNLSFSSDNAPPVQAGVRMSEIVTRYPGVVHVGEVVLSLAAPVLTLAVAGITGLVRKEPFSAALLRTLQRGALILLTLLTVAYAVALVATARVEAQANADLDSRVHNAAMVLRQRSERRRNP